MTKVMWIVLTLMLLVVYAVASVTIVDKLITIDKLEKDALVYQTRKTIVSKKMISLSAVQNSLQEQLVAEKNMERQKMLELQLERVKAEQERAAETTRLDSLKQEQARLAELQRQQEQARLDAIAKSQEQARLAKQQELQQKATTSRKTTRAS